MNPSDTKLNSKLTLEGGSVPGEVKTTTTGTVALGTYNLSTATAVLILVGEVLIFLRDFLLSLIFTTVTTSKQMLDACKTDDFKYLLINGEKYFGIDFVIGCNVFYFLFLLLGAN